MKEIQKKRDNVVNSNNDDGNDDDNDNFPRSPPASPGVPRPPLMQDLFPDDYNNPFNVNLNNLEQEYQNRSLDIETVEPPAQLDTNLKAIFPDADEILEVGGNHYSGIESYNKQHLFPYTGKLKPAEQAEIETEIQFLNGGREGAVFYWKGYILMTESEAMKNLFLFLLLMPVVTLYKEIT